MCTLLQREEGAIVWVDAAPLSSSSEVPVGTIVILPLDNPSLCLTCSAGIVLELAY